MTAEMERALEDIVKSFLLHETKSGQTENIVVENPPVDNNNSQLDQDQDEFVKNLYNCLAERGILRELHAFLRQRLVEILKGTYPNLVVSGCSENFNWTVLKLFEDFLCCHKLLFTFSVLVTETDNSNYAFRRGDFGKMMCKDAENLLDDLNIRKDSELSRKILKLYSEKEHSSLLECIIGVSSWGQEYVDGGSLTTSDWQFLFPHDNRMTEGKTLTSLFDDPKNIAAKLKQVDYEFAERLNPGGIALADGADGKFLQMQLVMEKDKQLQIKNAIQRFREEEIMKIRDEIETRLKFEMISKEKELLRNYEDRVIHMKNLLEREKDVWFAERSRKEKELFTQRQDLVKLMEHVKEKKVKLKEALERIEHGKEPIGHSHVSTDRNNIADSSIASEETSSDRDKENNFKVYNLESAIKRLQEENLHLKKRVSKQSRYEEVSRQHRDNYFGSPPEECSIKSARSGVNEDKIALLQYTVEKQTEELEKLKRQITRDSDSSTQFKSPHKNQQKTSINSLDNVQEMSHQKTFLQGNSERDNDLETFLANSKRRFAEIEKKAELVGSSLREVFKRNSGDGLYNNNTNSSATSFCVSMGKVPPTVPKLPYSLQKKSTGNTKSILTPRLMNTATSSIDQALKSFLLSQDSDPFNSNIPNRESEHVKSLLNSTSFLHQPSTTITTSAVPVSQKSTTEHVQKISLNSVSNSVQITQKHVMEEVPSPIITPISKPPLQHTEEKVKQPIPSTVSSQKSTPESPKKKITEPETPSLTTVAKDNVPNSNLTSKKDSPIKNPMIERIQMESTVPNNTENNISKKSIESVAGSSGALIQSKIPSPDNSQQHPLTSTKLQKNEQKSWGQILSSDPGHKPRLSISSSNSISFVEGGGADDDDDYMAEEDFWVL